MSKQNIAFSYSQKQTQKTQQKLSQKQIQSLKILSMASDELAQEIQRFADENPALEIENPKNFSDFNQSRRQFFFANSNSQDPNSALENTADNRESLKSHLLKQFYMAKFSDAEKEIGERLIDNLDADGFHILDPASLFKNKLQSSSLKKIMEFIQTLDPIGTCTKNFQQSLLVQAKLDQKSSALSKFILDEHFDFLDPPIPQKISKKIKNYRENLKKIAFLGEKEKRETEFLKNPENFSQENCSQALSYIKTLDPFPARAFGFAPIKYAFVDVYVLKTNDGNFKIELAKEGIPSMKISSEFLKSEQENNAKNFIRKNIDRAQVFIDSVLLREETLANACKEIVVRQKDFFKNGPGFLKPLLQKDLAKILGVHESTISRIANGKYLSCEWGVFEIGYFFSQSILPSIKNKNAKKLSKNIAKENVKIEISKIIANQKKITKKLSDREISEELAKRGYNVARRTVSKYRTELSLAALYTL